MRDDNLDRELDAALTRYAVAEPRHGLEERVLQSLRARRERRVARNLPRWSFAMAGAAVAVLVAIVFWYGTRTIRVTQGPSVTSQPGVVPTPAVVVGSAPGENNLKRQIPHMKERQRPRTYALTVETPANDAPKLEQFPAPVPLTDQETLLLRFVENDPNGASLVAQEQMETLQREADEMKALGLSIDSRVEER